MKCLLFTNVAKPLALVLPMLLVSCGGGFEDDGNAFEDPGTHRPAFGWQGEPKPKTDANGTTTAPDVNVNVNVNNTNTAPANPEPPVTGTSGGVPSVDPQPVPPVQDPPPANATANAGTTATSGNKPVKNNGNLPFGVPVLGKKGYVYSPYAMDKGMVDVSELSSGTKVECPYTFKHFRVP